jgi:hypothetical protein
MLTGKFVRTKEYREKMSASLKKAYVNGAF